jgi:hypothetical protein
MRHTPIKLLQRHRLNIIVIFLYFIFTLIFTFPLVLHFSTATPLADGSLDQFQSMWMFWWFKTALFELHTNPLSTDFMYYPQGTSLIYHMSLFLGLLALSFQCLFASPDNLVIGHNVILIFTFVLSGLGAYLLTKYLVKDTVTAFICGLLFAFCPYRLWHLNHLNLLSTQWIPFYMLYLMKSVDGRSLKDSLWAGVFLIFTFLSSLTYILFLAFFTLIYFLYQLMKSRKRIFNKRLIKNSAIALLIVIIILSPVLYGLYSSKIDWEPSLEASSRYSANLLGYLLPIQERSLLGSHFLPSRWDYHGIAGGELFLGYVLLFFMAYTWIKFPKKKIKLWFFSSMVFLLLSLGHSIHIHGHSYYFKWLPYSLLYTYLPFLQIGRTPCRFSVMVTLCMIIFSSYGLAHFFASRKTQNKIFSDVKNFFRGFLVRKGMPIVIVVLICLEFIVFPTTLIKVGIPECYEEVRNAKEEFAIFELPAFGVRSRLMCNVYLLYQTFHGKKLVNGSLTRPSYNSKDFLNEVFAIQDQAKPGTDMYAVVLEKLRERNVKFIIVRELQTPLKLKKGDMGSAILEEDPLRIGVFQVF